MNFAFYPFPHSMEQKENSIMRQLILDRAASVTQLDSAAMEQARARQQQLTKPAGSLGRLEDIAIQHAKLHRMPTKLTLRPHETELNHYHIMGLPQGHSALIQFENGEWWIQHADDPGHVGEWVGNYHSAEGALAALEAVL